MKKKNQIEYKYLVEYVICPNKQYGFQTYTAKFTNVNHARNFFRRIKREGVKKVKLFEIDSKGEKVKELRPKV